MKPRPRYQPGDRIGGRYQVHKSLLGGIGEVYLCLDLEEMRPYALKTFQQRYMTDTQHLRRAFEQEVATWVALEKHPNIVRCFYMETLDNQPFMVLEWVAGEEGRETDLRSWLRRGPLDLKLALEVTIDICNGLIHAQTKQPGLVHRDLKPENILMAQGGLAKITDFGLAQVVTTTGLEVAPTGVAADNCQSFVGNKGIVGTPAYMAPEQWRGETLDERTDIYALGVMLYEMLTGAWPFQISLMPTFQARLCAMQAAHEHAPLLELPTGLPTAMNDLLQSCLAKTQPERPVSLTAIVTWLTNMYGEYIGQALPTRPAPGAFTSVDYNNRGTTYADLGQHKAALTDYARAIELNPSYAWAYYNRGNTYHTLGQYEAELTDYSRAISLDPSLAQAYGNRGVTYADLGQYKAALDDFARAIELNPDGANTYANRGTTYQALGQHEVALADFDRAMALAPHDAKIYYYRGLSHHALGQFEIALVDYDRATDLDATFDPTYANRGLTNHALGRYEAALLDHTWAIKLNPNKVAAYTNRGTTYAALGRYEAALADYDYALKLDPNDANIYANRGATYQTLGRYAEALSDQSRAIELVPNYVQAYDNRGLTYTSLGKHKAALADFVQALELDPNYAQAYLNLGVLWGSQGKHREGLPYFEKAAKLGIPQGAQYAAYAKQMLGFRASNSD